MALINASQSVGQFFLKLFFRRVAHGILLRVCLHSGRVRILRSTSSCYFTHSEDNEESKESILES